MTFLQRLCLLGTLVVIISATGPARAAYPGTNGKIAWIRGGYDNPGIWVMNPDGSEQTLLVPQVVVPHFGWVDRPKWSPDGQRLAFVGGTSSINGCGTSDIYVVNADGSGLVSLTNGSAVYEYDPTWSPDGQRIAFTVLDLVENNGVCTSSGDFDIWVMNADGSNRTQLTSGGIQDGNGLYRSDEAPAWSPDGQRIAFQGFHTDSNLVTSYQIYTMNPDGTGITKLTDTDFLNPSDGYRPAWSPDGQRIAYERWRFLENIFQYEIWVMNADGSGEAMLTQTNSVLMFPVWSPDGQMLVFTDGNTGEILRINADGTGLTQLTDDPTVIDWIPDWQPLPAAGNGDVVVTDDTSQTFLDGLTTVLGNLRIIDTALTSVVLPGLASVSGNVDVTGNTAAATIDLSVLETAGGNVDVTGNAAATTIDLGSLQTAGGDVDVTGNTAATSIDFSQLTVVGGDVNVSDNTSATSIDFASLTTAGGDVNVGGNTSGTSVDFSSLETAGGDVNVSGNSSCTTVLFPELDTVAGNVTVESCGTGTFSLTGTSTGGSLTLATSGYAITTGTTAAGSTVISSGTSQAVMTVQLEAETFVSPVSFSVARLDAAALPTESGTDANGDPVLVDPVVAYEITFGVPTLNRDATLSFDVHLDALGEATRAAFLAALNTGGVTLATSSDGGAYQTFPVCAGETPTAGGCVLVQRLDANGLPTTDTLVIVRFSNVVGHFSTWAVAFVSAAPDDTTPPAIVAKVAGAAGQNGWYVGDVTVTWDVTDGESRVTSPWCETASVSSDTAGVTLTCTATSAGGTASASVTIKLDKTPPAIAISAPAGVYVLGQQVAASYSCTDAGSGLASCIGTLPSGVAVNTSSPGAGTFVVDASDQAGNAALASTIYSVQYQAAGTTCLGEGGHQILAPIETDGTSIFRRNGTVPAKFRVCDASGRSIGTPGVVSSFQLIAVIAGTMSTAVDTDVLSATPDSMFRWDPAEEQWIFNISNASLQSDTTYVYRIGLNDGTLIDFRYGVR